MFGKSKDAQVATMTATFYGRDDAVVTVDIDPSVNATAATMILSGQYVAKLLFNYGRHQRASQLHDFVKAAAFEILGQDLSTVQRPSVTGSNLRLHEAPPPSLRPVEIQEGRLMQRPDEALYIQTKGSSDPAHFPFASVALLFQHLINTLDDGALRLFAVMVIAMTEYYETKPWTSPATIVNAPAYGMAHATDLLTNP